MSHSAQTLPYRPAAPPRDDFGARVVLWLLSWLLGVTLLAGVAAWRYGAAYEGRIFEGVSVNGVALGGMTPEQAAAELQARLPVAGEQRLVLRAGGAQWSASATDLGIRLDPTAIAQAALAQGRTGNPLQRTLHRFALWRGSEQGRVAPRYARHEGAVESLVAHLANEVARDPQDAALTVQGLSISATPARPGRQLDVVASEARLLQAIEANEATVDLVVVERAPHVIGAEAAADKARALISTPLVLTFDQPDFRPAGEGFAEASARRQWMVDRARLAEMLLFHSRPLDSDQFAWDVRLKPEEMRAELATIATSIARAPRDARFDFDPATGTLTPLVVSQDGLRLDVEASLQAIEAALAAGEHEVPLVIERLAPAVATSDAARMNITGLAVTGFSDYTGSADEREVNLSVAASQYHGLVIPPGGLFSFNEHLGWVVDANGYEEGYIISGNRTEVDVGGGVCQVSTTIFRAAFNAGFEIVERHPHAYRVPYYENGSPLGFDATIFSPVVDLKFRNDTPNYYLMEIENNRGANTLQINLYGPPTGRKVELYSNTIETVPHGPAIYETDPALAPGVVKQVDWSHDGARILLRRIVRDEASGEEIRRDDFWSNYRPWQARYLVGPGGAPSQSSSSDAPSDAPSGESSSE